MTPRLIAVVLASALLLLTTACEPGKSIPAGTITSKGITPNPKNHSTCHWIRVRHDDGTKTQSCIAIARWKKAAEGGHWSGS
jgi:hypothetical protein